MEEEISRVVPIIEGIRAAIAAGTATTPVAGAREKEGRLKSEDSATGTPEGKNVTISVDTRRAAVAKAAVSAGADAVNDVSGGTFDPDMLAAVERAGVPLMMMHMR